jgi:hypothetical protein
MPSRPPRAQPHAHARPSDVTAREWNLEAATAATASPASPWSSRTGARCSSWLPTPSCQLAPLPHANTALRAGAVAACAPPAAAPPPPRPALTLPPQGPRRRRSSADRRSPGSRPRRSGASSGAPARSSADAMESRPRYSALWRGVLGGRGWGGGGGGAWARPRGCGTGVGRDPPAQWRPGRGEAQPRSGAARAAEASAVWIGGVWIGGVWIGGGGRGLTTRTRHPRRRAARRRRAAAAPRAGCCGAPAKVAAAAAAAAGLGRPAAVGPAGPLPSLPRGTLHHALARPRAAAPPRAGGSSPARWACQAGARAAAA